MVAMAVVKIKKLFRVRLTSFAGGVKFYIFAYSKEEVNRRLSGNVFGSAIKRVEQLKFFKWQ